jgi:hypothetical protein
MRVFREFLIEEVGLESPGTRYDQTSAEVIGSFAGSPKKSRGEAYGLRIGEFEERDFKPAEERPKSMAKNRLQFDFSDEALEQLDELKDATGAPTRAEVIRQALRMLQWTVEQVRDEDATVIVEKNGRQREVIFPFLSSAKATANGR